MCRDAALLWDPQDVAAAEAELTEKLAKFVLIPV